MSNGTDAHEFRIMYPIPGQWFLVAYVSENVDQVIKKVKVSTIYLLVYLFIETYIAHF